MTTYIVTTLADEALSSDQPFDAAREAADGTGLSLREALDLANALTGSDEIVFHPDLANGRVTLTGNALQITSDVTIEGDAAGDGTSSIILDGGYRSRVLEVFAGDAAISDVDITRGGLGLRDERGFGDGGGVTIAAEAELTIADARIYRNGAGDFAGSLGGGIYNEGTLRLTGSEVFQNSAGFSRSSSDGGGVANAGMLIIENTLISDNATAGRILGGGGGILNSGTTLATNVLFTGNVGLEGSAINNSGTMVLSGATITGNTPTPTSFGTPDAVWNTGQMTFVHSTITANTGAEIENRAELTLINSIVTEAPGAVITKIGQNIVGSALFDGDLQSGEVQSEDIFANIGQDGPVLADNGGTLPTLLLRASELNPALDAGDPALAVDATGMPLMTDARGAGFARTVDLPYTGATGNGLADLGALELRLDAADTLAFNDTVLPVLSYGGGQDRGTFDVSGSAGRLIQGENAWNHLLVDYEVTPDTILTFRLEAEGQAEIYGIGFDNDDDPESETYFQLGGTQRNFGLQDFNIGIENSTSAEFFQIPVGEYFTGQFDRLVFVTDQDAPGPVSQDPAASIWSDVALFEDGPRVRLNGALENVQSYSAQQDRGTATIFDNGFTLVQDSNSWKRIDIDYQVTEKTLLTFDFDSSNQGELHAIGFENDDVPDGDTFFTLLGTQDGFGIRDFYDTSVIADGPLSYEIPVGDYFTGRFDSLVLATDQDVGEGADSFWFDLTLTESL
ncbi:autotransporter outer membrane beta-barrel domain-containing protein [Roseobacter weihaiensis]|uniref:hypothetical protein n=1 Tax=Roseobacter weihaiensis TaxID=2763262 RepID=UPI001D0B2172|nr:hypothetical protein [Roseobacter sp. H9]